MSIDPARLFRLEGKVAVVTGANSGLGLEIARGFDRAGATVVALVRRPGDESLAWLPESRRIAFDVRDEGSVRWAFEEVARRVGGVDVLVNSAGRGGRASAAEYEAEMWRDVMATNVDGTFWASRAAAESMRTRGGGSIVNLASIGGLAGYPGSVGYQTSKGAVVQLTRSLAMEWVGDRIRVNALAPSQFETAMSRAQWAKDDSVRRFFEARTPMGIGDARDIVGPALFLASEASAMVTGHTLPVDGGYMAQ